MARATCRQPSIYGKAPMWDAEIMKSNGCSQRAVSPWSPKGLESNLDSVAEECAVALVYNGVSHAVMMTSPINLEEFALGFSLTEGIVARAEDIYDIQLRPHALGVEVQIDLSAERFALLKQKRRQLTGRTGCGLCGAESLQQVRAEIAPLIKVSPVSHRAIQRALAALESYQPLQALTGAVHGAAWCDQDGNILLVREDVGRHNALDKLIGARLKQKVSDQSGFALVSSRASYEMVQKAAIAGFGILVAVSAATTLAIEVAEAAGVTLVGFGRPNRHLVYSHPQRIPSAV